MRMYLTLKEVSTGVEKELEQDGEIMGRILLNNGVELVKIRQRNARLQKILPLLERKLNGSTVGGKKRTI